jgi:DNA-directed RNA polymerase specialized sigma24 family protein
MVDNMPALLHSEIDAILDLAPVERFVFVMSVLEGYSDNECSILLGPARMDIATARTRAMQQLVTLLGLNAGTDADPEVLIQATIAKRFASLVWTNHLFR